jgi:hypothetical protein
VVEGFENTWERGDRDGGGLAFPEQHVAPSSAWVGEKVGMAIPEAPLGSSFRAGSLPIDIPGPSSSVGSFRTSMSPGDPHSLASASGEPNLFHAPTNVPVHPQVNGGGRSAQVWTPIGFVCELSHG